MNPIERLERAKELLDEFKPDRALRLLGRSVPPVLAAERSFLAGEALREQGFFEAAVARYQQALRRGGDWDIKLDSCLGQAKAWRCLGMTVRARHAWSRASSFARRPGKPRAEELELENAMIERAEGDYPRALSHLEILLRRYQNRGDHAAAGFAFWAIAGARRFSGDLAGSERDYQRSLSLCRRVKDREGAVYALFGLGGVCRIRGRLHNAQGYYAAALDSVRGSPDLFARAYAHCGLANVLRRMGYLARARGHYLLSRALYGALKDRVDGAYVDWGLGQLALSSGDLRSARRYLNAALAAFTRFNETRGQVLSEYSLAAVLHAAGKTSAAEALFDRAVARARRAKIHAHLEIYT